jgi:hypothetical protein
MVKKILIFQDFLSNGKRPTLLKIIKFLFVKTIILSARYIISVVFLILYPISHNAFAQKLTQTVKGTIFDMDTKITLPGASVLVLDSDPAIGVVADAEGNFRLSGIPVGRISLQFSFVGYESKIISEIQVISGKEVVLQVGLKESAVTLQQVEVKAFSNKEKPVNPMAMISARQLTMEEASRYAGGLDDPSRLASSFAGVTGTLSSNAIVIRGNAPKGLLWRMEGVEIPNPSHFANVNTFGGGGITALSAQMLTNSDFYTGAFPAEYGNALSGVFDMKLRTGNNEEREYTFKAGTIGIDFASEGPFVKGKKSSYLFNYRYSTLALLSSFLPENAQGIKYQDFSYHIHIPAGKASIIGFWGLLSGDATGSKARKDSAEWQYYQDMEQDRNINRMAAIGLNHRMILSDKTYINTSLSFTTNYISWFRERFNNDLELYRKDDIKQFERKYALSFLINHKFGAGHTNRSGMVVNRLEYDVDIRQRISEVQDMMTYANGHGTTDLIQLFSQSQLNLSPGVVANLGVHSQVFMLNGSYSIEPRAGVRWNFSNNQSLNIAYGMHSRLEPVSFYLARKNEPSGSVQPNRKLGLTRAHHLVIGYEASTGKCSRLRIEPYFQRLYNVPVIPGSSFSMSNLEMDWFFNDSLVNRGTATNLGIDLTLERFLQDGYYYLITGSLFDSKYRGGDGIMRNGRFNRQYVINFLFGKEWKMGHEKNNTLGINWKFSFMGGKCLTPVDNAASIAAHDVIYDENKAFTSREPAGYYLDLTLSWQKNKPGYSSTWAVQFMNVLFQQEFYGYRYNFRSNSIDPLSEPVVVPNISYRIDF